MTEIPYDISLLVQRFDTELTLGKFNFFVVNLAILELSYRFQTLHYGFNNSWVLYEKRRKSIIVTRKSARLFKTCRFFDSNFSCDTIILFIYENVISE